MRGGFRPKLRFSSGNRGKAGGKKGLGVVHREIRVMFMQIFGITA